MKTAGGDDPSCDRQQPQPRRPPKTPSQGARRSSKFAIAGTTISPRGSEIRPNERRQTIIPGPSPLRRWEPPEVAELKLPPSSDPPRAATPTTPKHLQQLRQPPKILCLRLRSPADLAAARTETCTTQAETRTKHRSEETRVGKDRQTELRNRGSQDHKKG
jgi:hypothetical protein